MPYKSKAQQRKFFAMEAEGKLPKGTARTWAHHTPDIKALPEHVGDTAEQPAKTASLLDRLGLGLSGARHWHPSNNPGNAGTIPTKQACAGVLGRLGLSGAPQNQAQAHRSPVAVNAFTAHSTKIACLRAVNAFTAHVGGPAVKRFTEAIHSGGYVKAGSVLDGWPDEPQHEAVYRVKASRLLQNAVAHAKSASCYGSGSLYKAALLAYQGPQSQTVPAAQAQAALQSGIRPTPGVMGASITQPPRPLAGAGTGGAGGSNPQSHPIQSFSGLGTDPTAMSSYNGNAALGTRNCNV